MSNPAIEIQKNKRETIRITREDYKGVDLINIRTFFDAGEGDMRPGKQGIAVRAELVPELIAALQSHVKEGAA